jgi:hypothetical protein
MPRSFVVFAYALLIFDYRNAFVHGEQTQRRRFAPEVSVRPQDRKGWSMVFSKLLTSPLFSVFLLVVAWY